MMSTLADFQGLHNARYLTSRAESIKFDWTKSKESAIAVHQIAYKLKGNV